MRLFAQEVPGSHFVAIPDSGHSAYWERPDLFNAAVLDFLARHRA
jgi:pimeloyl-ACP methyl ester carboxylesterase